MALSAGYRLGPYEVLSLIGAGGMGEVYRARDTRLDRDVAVKILPEGFAADAERVARFQREAKVLASLTHPNIAIIHGLEHADGAYALVMELVEGEDLAQRVARGPIPLAEALPIAKQIADALEAAHEQGIVHRDLKPANIKVRSDETVKVLDFGLAKALDPTASRPDNLANSPTLSMQATHAGVILGTAAYMSPEQTRGSSVDKRADLWALGVVLYEMLSGKRLFERATVSDTLAAVLKTEPDWIALPAETPLPVRKLLRRCLAKDRKQRLADASDARLEIEDAIAPSIKPVPLDDGSIFQRGSLGGSRLAWTLAAVFAVVAMAAIAAAAFGSRPVAVPREVRVDLATPPSTDSMSFALSPDGRSLVFVATSDGQPKLWLRSLDDGSVRTLAGSERATLPFWSPDSRAIGFFADQRLKRIDVTGGALQVLANAQTPVGGTWGWNGTIVFAPLGAGGLFRVPAGGGDPVAVTRLEASQRNHRRPVFLSDSQHFVFYAVGTPSDRGLYIGSLDGAAPHRLLDADRGAVVAQRQLLFVRQETLFAQPFDPVRLEITGTPSSIAGPVPSNYFSASATDAIAFRVGTEGDQRQLIWFDRAGRDIARVAPPASASAGIPGSAGSPELSPDGRRIALSRVTAGNSAVLLLDSGRSGSRRLTSDDRSEALPVWSPDGRFVVFFAGREGSADLVMRPSSGGGPDELVLATPLLKAPSDWSADGRFLLYTETDPKIGNFALWALPMDTRKPFPILQTKFNARDARLSADGKWIAYQSDESGRTEVYVQPFPGAGDRVQISTDGGTQVRWRRDGKELFYMALDGRLMAVMVKPSANGPLLEVGAPVPLFMTHVPGGAVQAGGSRQQYDVSADGQRFLVNTIVGEAATPPITLILNWKLPSPK